MYVIQEFNEASSQLLCWVFVIIFEEWQSCHCRDSVYTVYSVMSCLWCTSKVPALPCCSPSPLTLSGCWVGLDLLCGCVWYCVGYVCSLFKCFGWVWGVVDACDISMMGLSVDSCVEISSYSISLYNYPNEMFRDYSDMQPTWFYCQHQTYTLSTVPIESLRPLSKFSSFVAL